MTAKLWCLVGAVLFVARPAYACLNDRDTLANEAGKLPSVLAVVTGRFERNPPLYYEMRISRESADIAAHPMNLPEYDDVAVAFDRLGRYDEAIAWMARKQTALLAVGNVATAEYKAQLYSYNANLGTFLVERWVASGADRKNMGDVDRARTLIRRALLINPNAHWGREKYQLMVMDWISDGGGESLASYIWMDSMADPGSVRMTEFGAKSEALRKEAITGLSGLVVLGNAWQSVDIFDALSHLLAAQHYDYTERLGYLAELRRDELIDHGNGSLTAGAGRRSMLKAQLGVGGVQPNAVYASDWLAHSSAPVDSNDFYMYRLLRADADRWQNARTKFMTARLRAGQHPDTDPGFWSSYHTVGAPDILNPWDEAIYVAVAEPLRLDYLFLWFFVIVVAGALSIRIAVRSLRDSTDTRFRARQADIGLGFWIGVAGAAVSAVIAASFHPSDPFTDNMPFVLSVGAPAMFAVIGIPVSISDLVRKKKSPGVGWRVSGLGLNLITCGLPELPLLCLAVDCAVRRMMY